MSQYVQPVVYIGTSHIMQITEERGRKGSRGSHDCLRQPGPVKCSIVLNLSTVTKENKQERNGLTEGERHREGERKKLSSWTQRTASIPQVWVEHKATHKPAYTHVQPSIFTLPHVSLKKDTDRHSNFISYIVPLNITHMVTQSETCTQYCLWFITHSLVCEPLSL